MNYICWTPGMIRFNTYFIPFVKPIDKKVEPLTHSDLYLIHKSQLEQEYNESLKLITKKKGFKRFKQLLMKINH